MVFHKNLNISLVAHIRDGWWGRMYGVGGGLQHLVESLGEAMSQKSSYKDL